MLLVHICEVCYTSVLTTATSVTTDVYVTLHTCYMCTVYNTQVGSPNVFPRMVVVITHVGDTCGPSPRVNALGGVIMGTPGFSFLFSFVYRPMLFFGWSLSVRFASVRLSCNQGVAFEHVR